MWQIICDVFALFYNEKYPTTNGVVDVFFRGKYGWEEMGRTYIAGETKQFNSVLCTPGWIILRQLSAFNLTLESAGALLLIDFNDTKRC